MLVWYLFGELLHLWHYKSAEMKSFEDLLSCNVTLPRKYCKGMLYIYLNKIAMKLNSIVFLFVYVYYNILNWLGSNVTICLWDPGLLFPAV